MLGSGVDWSFTEVGVGSDVLRVLQWWEKEEVLTRVLNG